MKLMDLIARHGSRIYWREKPVLRQFDEHIASGESVLDIGAGSGKLAQLLSTARGAHVELIDVVDHNVTKLPLHLYDGAKLPYDDNAFDACLLVFVLHHASNPEQLIREALRVSGGRVIVVEDTPANSIERAAWQKWDYFLNHGHHDDIAVAHQSRSPAQWRQYFEAAGAHVVAERSFRTYFPVLGMYRHTAFVLEKR